MSDLNNSLITQNKFVLIYTRVCETYIPWNTTTTNNNHNNNKCYRSVITIKCKISFYPCSPSVDWLDKFRKPELIIVNQVKITCQTVNMTVLDTNS